MELQKLRCYRWYGWARQISEVITFFEGHNFESLHYDGSTLTVRVTAPHFQNVKAFQLEKDSVLVYSAQTGYQVVSEQLFKTFVKE